VRSEFVLKVGKRGEIYTSKKLREAVGIEEGGRVRAVVSGGKLIIEPIPTIERLIRRQIIEVTPEEAERLSEEAQREAGAYG